jgi:hypothetical protein
MAIDWEEVVEQSESEADEVGERTVDEEAPTPELTPPADD